MTPNSWRLLAAALVAQIGVSITEQGLPVLAGFIKLDLGLSAAAVGLVVASLPAGKVIASYPVGRAVDRVGERSVLFVGTVGAGVLVVSAALVPLGALVVLLVAAGVFVSTMGPAGGKLVLTAFPPARRGFAMGLRQTGIPIGGLVAAALLPWLAATWGWRTSLLVAGLFTCAGAVVVFALVGFDLREEREAVRALAGGERRAVLIRDRDIMLITLWGAILVGGQHALLAFLALDLHQAASLSLPVAASLLIFAQAGGIVGRIGWGLASDRLLDGRRRPLLLVITALALATALALVVLPSRASFGLLAVVALLAGLSLIGYQGLWLTTIAELGGPRRAGEVMGFGLMFIALAAVLSTPLYGLVADLAGDFSAIWVVLAGMLAIAFVPAALLRERPAEVAA